MDENEKLQLELVDTRCGCGGEITPGLGCNKYWGSNDFDNEATIESAMRSGGLGFAIGLSTDQAVMSAHLQDHGFSADEAVQVLFAKTS